MQSQDLIPSTDEHRSHSPNLYPEAPSGGMVNIVWLIYPCVLLSNLEIRRNNFFTLELYEGLVGYGVFRIWVWGREVGTKRTHS